MPPRVANGGAAQARAVRATGCAVDPDGAGRGADRRLGSQAVSSAAGTGG